MTSSEKTAMMSQFNDPTSNTNVLVLNKRCGAAGLNFHYCCHIGISAQPDWNIGTDVQGRGRLIRLGQKHEVEWIGIRVNDTAYDFYEMKSGKKEVDAMDIQLVFPDHVSHSKNARKILCYEVLRVAWSHPFHRFVWEIHHPRKIQDFNSKQTRAYAQCYHFLARLFLSTAPPPEDVPDIMKKLDESIDVIAPRWREKVLDGDERVSGDGITWNDLRVLLEDLQNAGDWVQHMRRDDRNLTYFGSSRKRKMPYLPGLFEEDAPPRKNAKNSSGEKSGDESAVVIDDDDDENELSRPPSVSVSDDKAQHPEGENNGDGTDIERAETEDDESELSSPPSVSASDGEASEGDDNGADTDIEMAEAEDE